MPEGIRNDATQFIQRLVTKYCPDAGSEQQKELVSRGIEILGENGVDLSPEAGGHPLTEADWDKHVEEFGQREDLDQLFTFQPTAECSNWALLALLFAQATEFAHTLYTLVHGDDGEPHQVLEDGVELTPPEEEDRFFASDLGEVVDDGGDDLIELGTLLQSGAEGDDDGLYEGPVELAGQGAGLGPLDDYGDDVIDYGADLYGGTAEYAGDAYDDIAEVGGGYDSGYDGGYDGGDDGGYEAGADSSE